MTPMTRRPNIILLMDDQHRGDALGVAGNRAVRTPHLDRLAGEGAWYRHAYASMPSCIPARASLLTGMSPWGHGMLGWTRMASRYPFEMPRMLRDAGYHTVAIGKMHFLPHGTTYGFDRMLLEETFDQAPGFLCDYRRWLATEHPGVDHDASGLGYNDRRSAPWPHDEALHPTSWTTDHALNFLRNFGLPGGDPRPYFLKVSYQRPHPPYDPPKRQYDEYANADLPPAAVGQWAEDLYGTFTDAEPPDGPRAKLPADVVRNSRQGYYASITHVDEQIGKIMEALRARGDLERTIIVFCSDHGEMAGDHHLWRKTYAYDGSARVPMIVRWGSELLDAPRGQVRDEPVELRDILPTFLDAAGIGVPLSMEGRTLLDPVRGTGPAWRPFIDLEHAAIYWPANAWSALTDGRWKYIHHYVTRREQLFDLQADPLERDDLTAVAGHRATLEQWRQRMVEHLAPRGEPWVVDGRLGLIKQPILKSPNYPAEPAKAGA